MADHGIVRDDNILSGRWHMADTLIAVADIRGDYQHREIESTLPDHFRKLVKSVSTADIRGAYRPRSIGNKIPAHFRKLSRNDIQAALDFAFPEIRAASAELVFGSITLACACGEEAYGTAMANQLCVECQCGRSWTVDIELNARSGAI